VDKLKKEIELKKREEETRRKTNEGLTDLLKKMGVTIHDSFRTNEPRFPLYALIFRLIKLDPQDKKLKSLSQDAELMKQLKAVLGKLGADATNPLDPLKPLDLLTSAPGLYKFLSLVLRYLVQAKPGLLLDFLLQQKAFFNLLLWNSREWSFAPGELRKNRYELKLHSLIDFDMDNVYAATKDFQEGVITFLNFAVKEKAPVDVTLYATSLAALGYRSLMRENQGRYLSNAGDTRNPRLETVSDFPMAPSSEVIRFLIFASGGGGVGGSDAAAVALAFLRSYSKVELMRSQQPTGAMREIFAGLTSPQGNDIVNRVVKGPPTQKQFLHGTTTDVRILYLELWCNVLESGAAGGEVSGEQRRVFGSTIFDYFSTVLSRDESAILRARASAGLGLVLDKYPKLFEPRDVVSSLNMLLDVRQDDVFFGARVPYVRSIHPNPPRAQGGGGGGGGGDMRGGGGGGSSDRWDQGRDQDRRDQGRDQGSDQGRDQDRRQPQDNRRDEMEDLKRQIAEEERKRRENEEIDRLRRQIAEAEDLKRQIAEAEAKQRRGYN